MGRPKGLSLFIRLTIFCYDPGVNVKGLDSIVA